MHETTKDIDPPSAETLTRALVGVGAQFDTLLTHMRRHQASGLSSPDAPPPEAVLETLLSDCLAPLVARRPEDAAIAASMFEAIAAVIEDEIYIVPAQETAPHRGGRRRRRR